MNFKAKNLIKDESFEKRIEITCAMNGAKCEFIQGRIIDLDNTNVSFIEPHKVIIKIKKYKLLVLYFNKDNLFLYDRTIPITISKLTTLLKSIISGDYNG